MRYYRGFWWIQAFGEWFGFADIEQAFRFKYDLN